MTKKQIAAFTKYGGRTLAGGGWIATPFATIRLFDPSIKAEPLTKEQRGNIREWSSAAVRSSVRVTIGPEPGHIMGGPAGLSYPVSGLKPTGFLKGVQMGLHPVFVDIIKTQEPDRIVSVRVQKHVRAVATVKDGKCVGIFMPTRGPIAS